MKKHKEDQSQNVLVGNILISELLAYVLIDSSITRSFIFLMSIHKLGVMVELHIFPWEYLLPQGIC